MVPLIEEAVKMSEFAARLVTDEWVFERIKNYHELRYQEFSFDTAQSLFGLPECLQLWRITFRGMQDSIKAWNGLESSVQESTVS